jgi:hypothetical protein
VWRRALARFGFAATGILYGALGVTAARIALLGARDRVGGMPGALRLILGQAHGRTLLGAVAAGLAAFALWHLIEARNRRRTLLERAGHLAGAAGHAALAWSAVSLLLRLRQPPDSLGRSALEWLLTRSFGVLAVETAGVVTIGAGLLEIAQGVSGRLRDRFAARWLPRDAARFVKGIARFGLAARGGVLVLIGVFQVRVAVNLDPPELREIGGALKAVSQSTAAGPLLAGVVGLGLIAYGLSMGVLAVAARRT